MQRQLATNINDNTMQKNFLSLTFITPSLYQSTAMSKTQETQ